MKSIDLLNGFNFVDEQLIHEAQSKKMKRRAFRLFVPIAASFVLFLTAISIWSGRQFHSPIRPDNQIPPVAGDQSPHPGKDKNTPPAADNHDPQPDSKHKQKKYKLRFNKASGQIASSIAMKGRFWKDVTSLQAEKLLPVLASQYEIEGLVNYSHVDGITSVYNVVTSVNVDNKTIQITIAPDEVPKCYIMEGEPVLSEIEGVKIEAGIFITDKNSKGEQSYIYYADFKIGDAAYYVEYTGGKSDKKFFTNRIDEIIQGGEADLTVLDHPVVPQLRDDELTEEEAYFETDFGAYLLSVPKEYLFNGATRFINQEMDFLSAGWSKEYDDISVMISRFREEDKERIVSMDEKELYDMSLYPIPWADSMPRNKAHIIENPIFLMDDITPDVLKAREYIRNEQGESGGNHVNMRFSVLYDDILVSISTEGVSSEYVYEELLTLPHK